MGKRVLIILSAAFALAGCGGGGSAGPNLPGPRAFVTQQITPAGGTITVPNGPLAATVTFPANAIATSSQVTVTMFTPAGFPSVLQELKRKAKSVPADAKLIGAIEVEDGGTPLLKQLFWAGWHVLEADRVDHGELQHVIQRHFPSVSQPRLRVASRAAG